MKALKKLIGKDGAAAPPVSVRATMPSDDEFYDLVEKVERNQAKYRGEAFARMRAVGVDPPALEQAINLPRESWHASHVAMVLRAAARIEAGKTFEEAWS